MCILYFQYTHNQTGGSDEIDSKNIIYIQKTFVTKIIALSTKVTKVRSFINSNTGLENVIFHPLLYKEGQAKKIGDLSSNGKSLVDSNKTEFFN